MRKSIVFVSIALCACLQAEEISQDSTQANKNDERVLLRSTVTASPMRSKLDELSRNVYEIDKNNIQEKGYRSTEDIFRYTPFVGLANVGLGSNVDLRGQGNRANTSVQVLINGIYSNMLDSSHGVTPLNTLSPNAIESIEILPGGGAVMYGNGTRGGVVNIITQKRYEQPYFSAGLGYGYTLASTGNNINADVRYGDKVGDSTYLTLGAAYINRGGPRVGDSLSGGQVNLALLHDFTPGHSLSFDVDYFTGRILTTPNNSFMDIPNPTKSDRKTPGYGDMHNRQNRLDVSLGYEGQLTERAKLDIKAFYHLNRIDYIDSITMLSTYAYNMSTFNDASADQSGSLFDDQKAGLVAKFEHKGERNRLILGAESIYQIGKRTMNQHIFASNANITYNHSIYIPFNGTKWSNAIYALDKYNFTDRFSLTGGARYELALYDVSVSNSHNVVINGYNAANYTTPGSLKDSVHNWALEITPNFAYSDTGNLYFKYEKGFFSPSPNNMLRRTGTSSRDYRYEATGLKQEQYHTFELGLKDFWGSHVFFSAAAFYTLTNNEFYTIGNAHSADGVQYGNYDFTQRAGIELFSEQYFLNDSLRFSESFTYVDARVLKLNGASVSYQIPYVSNYKATIGISYAFNRHFSIWNQNSFYGAQKDIMQETNNNHQDTIPAYSLTDIGVNLKFGEFSLSGGVRNVFDTFYYSYYNGNSADTIAGYGFLIGQGRSAFIEGRYTF